jgi:hypothetical protein
MGLRSTFRPRVGPFAVNTDKALRPTSVTFKLGPLTYRLWSRRSRRGVSSVDLPGPWSWRPAARRRQRS